MSDCIKCGKAISYMERLSEYQEKGYCTPKCWDMTYWYLGGTPLEDKPIRYPEFAKERVDSERR